MAVFTEVSLAEAQRLMHQLNLGELTELRGIEGGIENTNYFATTGRGAYVLTLFERLTFAQLPFYLYLMKHLANHGIPVPEPAANGAGDILHVVCGKPAAVVSRLRGASTFAEGASATLVTMMEAAEAVHAMAVHIFQAPAKKELAAK